MALSKKFRNLEHYSAALSEGYQLLPFTFHKLAKGKYLIANLVGEYLLVNKKTLIELVDGNLEPSCPLYNEVKAKHFILDSVSNVALDLLALKYRTKQHPTSQFTRLHIFVVTLRCDYTCKYCQVSRKMEGDDSFDMSEEAAYAALKLVFMSPSKAIKSSSKVVSPCSIFSL